MNKLLSIALAVLCLSQMASIPVLKIELKAKETFQPTLDLPKPQFRNNKKLELRPLFKQVPAIQLRTV